MIKINLIKKKKSAGVNFDPSSILKLLGGGKEIEETDDGKMDFKKSPLFKLILVVVAVFVVDDTYIDFRKQELNRVNKKVKKVEAEIKVFEAKLIKVKGFEKVKKKLEKDELTLRTKLGVMKKLLENRNVPAKMLMHISSVIPEKVWLTEVRVFRGEVEISGGTPGYNEVSDFLKSLGESAYFSAVKLQGIKETNTKTKDQRFQSFQIKAKGRL